MSVNNNGQFVYNGTSPILLAPNGNATVVGSGLLTIGGGTFTTSQGFTNNVPSGGSLGYAQIILTNGGSVVLSANIPELTGVRTPIRYRASAWALAAAR